jgi:hypothetical protein
VTVQPNIHFRGSAQIIVNAARRDRLYIRLERIIKQQHARKLSGQVLRHGIRHLGRRSCGFEGREETLAAIAAITNTGSVSIASWIHIVDHLG